MEPITIIDGAIVVDFEKNAVFESLPSSIFNTMDICSVFEVFEYLWTSQGFSPAIDIPNL